MPAPFDLERIRAETFVADTAWYDETGSTNDTALDLCHRGLDRTPLLVLCGRQTLGRGRGKNRWWSAPGALTFSLVLHTDRLGLTESDWPKASLTTGLAICEGLNSFFQDQPARLKWPNDVYLAERKISGTLIEVGPLPEKPLIVGIGVNVNNSFHNAPPSLQSTSISLTDALGKPGDMTQVLVAVLKKLEESFRCLANHDAGLAEAWRRSCYLSGRWVEVDTGSRCWTGKCAGIDAEGGLLLETTQGRQRLFSGTVRVIRDRS